MHFSDGRKGHFGLQTVSKSENEPLCWSDGTMYNATTNYTRLHPDEFREGEHFVVFMEADRWRGDSGSANAMAICERSKYFFFSGNTQQMADFHHP